MVNESWKNQSKLVNVSVTLKLYPYDPLASHEGTEVFAGGGGLSDTP